MVPKRIKLDAELATFHIDVYANVGYVLIANTVYSTFNDQFIIN